MKDFDALQGLFNENGQGHVFASWKNLDQEERSELLSDCSRVDFAWLKTRLAEKPSQDRSLLSHLEPAQVKALPREAGEEKTRQADREFGEELIRSGKVAAFLVAGGQGTRLGYPGPKGLYPLGPISNRTLFEWHAEQILARRRRYGAVIPWYIMTSRDNHAATLDYFAAKDYFGLPREDIFLFIQDMVPSVTPEGKLLLASPYQLALNPNGHGGSLSGLCKSGAVKDMLERGVTCLNSFQIDNPLVTIADPLFVGCHAREGAAMSSKVLRKTGPEEKLGLVALNSGRPIIVEYSDLDPATMSATGADGELKFWAGSIGIHMLNVDFVQQTGNGDRLPWHRAHKKIPFFDGRSLVQPAEPNAIKFETFIFDALPFADRSVNLEVKREHEFAPVKNARGVDSAESSRCLLSAYFREWLIQAGITVPAECQVEISPLYSLDQAELATKIGHDLKLEQSLLLG
ncbi:MAG: UDPGP type 1 family protein [Planctomycetota bacterium]|jgi:UDP-N-acetylglucosamine/UDP-N-acetylgalactosamine diphosphorylase|nr:UDPGP type 1 family protein [Planctomycetota bacterium]